MRHTDHRCWPPSGQAFSWLRLVCGALVLLAMSATSPCLAAEPSAISEVTLSRPFFNPSLGQTVSLSFTLGHGGTLTVLILDRDGYLVRRLVSDKQAGEGSQSFQWDGRDDSGEVVPDEAYSLKIDLVGGKESLSYFPARTAAKEVEAKVAFYDRQGGVLGYKLASPARVHVQAGTNRFDARTKEQIGPALKTIANREPRIAGSVVEPWDGYDEGGTVYVPDLPHFSMSLFATSLPENALITIGNRSTDFLRYASRRHSPPLLHATRGDHSHHRGLTAFEDVSPRLVATIRNGYWSDSERLWRLSGGKLKLEVGLDGASALAFSRQPGSLTVFVDEEPIHGIPVGPPPLRFEVPVSSIGSHRIALNWISDYGPVSVASFRLRVGKDSAPSARDSGD